MGAWDVVEDEFDMNVINGTWAFKCKHFPTVLLRSLKAAFVLVGIHKLEGIDFFEAYAPVVQWTMVHLMLILEDLLGLKSKHDDVTAAFLHATLGEIKKSMWRCLLVSSIVVKTEKSRFFVSKNSLWLVPKSSCHLEISY